LHPCYQLNFCILRNSILATVGLCK
jgi:hypothetical protein